MEIIGIVVGVLVVLMLVLMYHIKQLYKRMPKLEAGESIPVVRPGESNLTIIRKGKDAFVSDEEGNLIPFKTEIN